MLISEALSLGAQRLRDAKIDEAQTECEHMMMKLLNVSRSVIHYDLCYLASAPLAQPGKKSFALTVEQEKKFLYWLSEREKRIPLAYLLGDTFFYSLKLKVAPGCLIPRPETERLVEETAAALKAGKKENPAILDIGTGSGAIGLALLSVFPKATAVLVDDSAEALKIARENAAELGFSNRAEFIQSNLFSNIVREKKYDAIVSNPPYLTEEDLGSLQPEVAFEPRMALDGGKDGLDFYRRIVADAKIFLKPNGLISFEVGAGQAGPVFEDLKKNGYEDLKIFKDHQEIERVVLGRSKD